jgi:Pyridoxamine 5'-phosphate oxidase
LQRKEGSVSEFFDHITPDHAAFIARQPMFFVATAAPDARINLSPKGMDCFRVLDGGRACAYLDFGGSGNETHAHLAADGRITIMFCAYDQPPLIYRIYGHGRAVLPQDAGWADLARHFTIERGVRQIFLIDVGSTQTSCGWAVPQMRLVDERQTLRKYFRQDDPATRLGKYAERTRSIDGLAVTPPAFLPYD